MSHYSKFHRRYLSAGPGFSVPITVQPIRPTSSSTITPRFQVDTGVPVPAPMPVPAPAVTKPNFWDEETFGVSNKIVAPVGAAIIAALLYKSIN